MHYSTSTSDSGGRLTDASIVRFLKTPKVFVDKGKVLLNASVVVTTDLGETFYPEDLELVASVLSSSSDANADIYLRRKIPCPAHARSVPISFNVSYQDLEWPACLHVEAKQASHGGSSREKVTGFLPPIVDVWSLPLNPLKGHMSSGRRVERRFTSLSDRPVSLLEDAGDSIARHLWDGSQALAQHIDALIALEAPAAPLPLLEYVLVSATYRRLHVLELGCGCGTVGIALAQSVPDCHVLLTDLAEVTELVEANIARMRPAMSSQVSFEPLDWEADALPARITSRTNDLIIVSECTYNTDTLGPLVRTLEKLLARSPKAIVVVATKTRHPSEAAFFDMMAQAGMIEDGRMRVPLPGLPGTGFADQAKDVGIFVFRGREHRLSLSPRESEDRVARRGRT